jgi:sarcosine oxidase subunit beta
VATELDFAKLAINAQTASVLFPVMRGATVVRSWAGIEGRLPDQIPVVGPSGTSEGVWHAFGLSAHGFQLGPVVGSVLADLIVRGRTDLPIDALAIGRFKTRTPDTA